jgi:hypothetical protein
MNRAHIATIVGAVVAAVFSSTALAGDAKNQAPFTRIVVKAPQAAVAGEPKDMAPFTRPASRPRAVPDWFERYVAAHPYGHDGTGPSAVTVAQASRQSVVPDWFERYAAAHPYGRDATGPAVATTVRAASAPVTGSAGFHWQEALLGAGAATAACLLCLALAVNRMRRREHTEAHGPLGV